MRAADQGAVPGFMVRRPIDESVEGLFANLGAGVGETGGDRDRVFAGGDGIDHGGGNVGAFRNGGERAIGRAAEDDFQQIVVG